MDYNMKKIVLLEPCISSLNQGDHVIVDSIKREMDFLLRDAFVVEQSTQSPVMHFYQVRDERFHAPADADYKFVCGSNLFWDNMFHPYVQWNINHLTCTNSRNAILVGAGSCSTRERMNLYSKSLYNRVLNHDICHSVRDEITKVRMESLGFKVINTGCPTTWSLTKEHCEKIPVKKGDRVVFTLNEFHGNVKEDLALIDLLARHYEEVYFWPQGYRDLEYLKKLDLSVPVRIVSPNLTAMRALLQEGNIDYVGSRLHGGIFSMQNYVRSMILVVDNRAQEMKDSFTIPALGRTDYETLETMIQSEWETAVNIRQDNIQAWKDQFR